LPGLGAVAHRQRAHGTRRRALHSLSLALARHPGLVAYTRTLTRARRARLARIALIFEFVHRLAAAEAVRRVRAQKLREAGLREGDLPAALLWAMLRAAGERARVEYTREMAFVAVAVAVVDVRRLPPWARLLRSGTGGLEVGLAPGGRWTPAGYLPPEVRGALQSRRPPAVLAAALAS
jgi:hypothetical protein